MGEIGETIRDWQHRLVTDPLQRMGARRRARQQADIQRAVAKALSDPEGQKAFAQQQLAGAMLADFNQELGRVQAEGDQALHLKRLIVKRLGSGACTLSAGPLRRPGTVKEEGPLKGASVADALLLEFPETVDGRLGKRIMKMPYQVFDLRPVPLAEANGQMALIEATPLFEFNTGNGKIKNDEGLTATHVGLLSKTAVEPRVTLFGETPSEPIMVLTDSCLLKGGEVVFDFYNVDFNRNETVNDDSEESMVNPIQRLGIMVTASELLHVAGPVPLMQAKIQRSVSLEDLNAVTFDIDVFRQPYLPRLTTQTTPNGRVTRTQPAVIEMGRDDHAEV